MPTQFRAFQPGRSAPFVPGGSVSLEIPRTANLESIMISLGGTVTYGASANAGDEVVYAAQRLIERVELIAGGNNTICSVPGWALSIVSTRNPSGAGELGRLEDPIASATQTVYLAMMLDQIIYDGIRPKDAILMTRDFDYLELKVTFADWSRIYVNSRSYPTGHTLQLTTQLIQTVETDYAASRPTILVRRSSLVIDATTANSDRVVRLPAGNAIRRVDILSLTGTGQASASETLINRLKLRNGLDVRADFTPLALRNINRFARYGAGNYAGTLTLDFGVQGIGNSLATNNWAVPNPAEPELVLDHNGATGGQIQVVTTEYLTLKVG